MAGCSDTHSNAERMNSSKSVLVPVPSAQISSPDVDVQDGDAQTLPLLKDTDLKNQKELFLNKLKQCCALYDFSDTVQALEAKEVKRATLNELIDFISSAADVLHDDVYPAVINVISGNIFRPLPPHDDTAAEIEEHELNLEASWPHLQLVYEFFLRVLESNEFQPTVAKKFLDHKFIQSLLDMFRSVDPREREFLKTVLHRIYGKFLPYRSFIRRKISHIFLTYTYETEDFAGMAELLEVLGSIINGFSLPLKMEHQQFLLKVLIPLHKAKHLIFFHAQLSYCVMQFLEKDQTLNSMVIQGILKYWPQTCSSKEVLFISEIEEILDVMEPSQFAHIHKDLFMQLAKCIASPHFQVAERVLYLWNNDYIVSMIEQNFCTILPIIFPNLYQISKTHWNSTIIALVFNVLKTCMDMDEELFNKLTVSFKIEQQKELERKKDREDLWRRVNDLCLRKKALLISDSG